MSNLYRGEEKANLMFTNLPWPGPVAYQVLAVDAEHNLSPIASGTWPREPHRLPLTIKPATVLLIRLSRPSSP